VIDRALASRADAARRSGIGAASWLDASLLRAGPFYDVVISADANAGDALDEASRALAAPWAVVTHVPAGGPDPAFDALVAASHAKTSGSARAKAFVCSGAACKAPTTDPAAVRAQILEGWAR
jgi:uncharacterized protein YyaL (SSP411 family)